VLLVVYMAWIVPYVRSDVGPRPGAAPRLPLATTLLLLAVAAAGSAFVSDWFVHSLEPGIRALGITRTFAGLVIVAIAGNAVEHVVGVVLAAKGRSDLAISVVKNSAVQIAAFLLPLIVIVSVAFARSLTFSLSPINTGALALTALAVWQVTGDGEAAAYEGWALIATYAILATITFYE
jgi:Ca2+:H+ antiporter